MNHTTENQWQPTNLDLILSIVLALGFPFLANVLYSQFHALLPMLLYYGLAWGIVKWRRGSTGYTNKAKQKFPLYFVINVGVIGISLIFAYFARIVQAEPNLGGIVVTALIWAPLNAASEQLLWIYIFDSWDLYLRHPSKPKNRQWAFRIVGLLLFTAFVGMIHTFFWVNFLHTVDSSNLFGVLFVIGTTISGYLHIVVWRTTNQMIYTFIPHFMLNLFPLFWTFYSIVPYLW